MKKKRTRACTCKKKVVSLHANWGGTIQSTEQKHEGKQRFRAFTEAKRTRNNALITRFLPPKSSQKQRNYVQRKLTKQIKTNNTNN